MSFKCWLNLTHTDKYINGPFVFATTNGCKTQDRISQTNWDALAKKTSISTTLYLGLIFLCTQFMLTEASTLYSTM